MQLNNKRIVYLPFEYEKKMKLKKKIYYFLIKEFNFTAEIKFKNQLSLFKNHLFDKLDPDDEVCNKDEFDCCELGDEADDEDEAGVLDTDTF